MTDVISAQLITGARSCADTIGLQTACLGFITHGMCVALVYLDGLGLRDLRLIIIVIPEPTKEAEPPRTQLRLAGLRAARVIC